MDLNYELCKILIRDFVVENFFNSVVWNIVVYKCLEDYIFVMDIYYVEFFNNVFNIFYDKWISFGDDFYKMRIVLVICYWNENVDRYNISVYEILFGEEKKILVCWIYVY